MEDRIRGAPRIASFRELRVFLAEDYAVNHRRWGDPGFQAVAVYRIGVWCDGIRRKVFRAPVRAVYFLLNWFVRSVYGIEISWRTRIGRRFRIAHQNGIVIHPHAVIGDDCMIRQGVTIGANRKGSGSRPPILGNRVEVGAGAVITGPITLGDGVIVGPNAVVMTNVPAGSMVVSPQARIITPPPRRAPEKVEGADGDLPPSPVVSMAGRSKTAQ